MQAAVEPVMPSVFHDEDYGNLESHLPERRERHAPFQAKVCGDRVKEPDLGELNSEMTDENNGCAVPLLLERWHLLALNFVLLKKRNLVHEHKRKTSTKVDQFVQEETHEPSREDIVLHEEIPGLVRFDQHRHIAASKPIARLKRRNPVATKG